MNVTVMGLGLNGGGLEAARYLAAHGAKVTVTDQGDEKRLAPSIEKLEASGFSFRYVLGRHENADFSSADMVIKNPAVRPDSPYLALARRIETDISLFLASSPARLTAVSGSKGKSTTASALYHVLREARDAGPGSAGERTNSPQGGTGPEPAAQESMVTQGRAFLGGNITVSPLTFLDDLSPEDDVVLELSSFQLGDLRGRRDAAGRVLLRPRAALITAIMPDHLDRYGSMEAYTADKRLIYQGQGNGDITVVFGDSWGRRFAAESPARSLINAEKPLPPEEAGGWLEGDGAALMRPAPGSPPVPALPAEVLVPGRQQKRNLLHAALALADMGIPAGFTAASLARFPGIEHRLEFFYEKNGLRFYNDSAATIPEAAAAAVEAFSGPLALLTGGTDKDLDFTPLARTLAAAFRRGRLTPPVLFAGTGSVKLKAALDAAAVPCRGPYDDLDRAVEALLAGAEPGAAALMSPGCASFGMFKNEFDRGLRFKESVRRLA
jgi:UDP-N-acetylmuramoylalanine--D-glutamate ligase